MINGLLYFVHKPNVRSALKSCLDVKDKLDLNMPHRIRRVCLKAVVTNYDEVVHYGLCKCVRIELSTIIRRPPLPTKPRACKKSGWDYPAKIPKPLGDVLVDGQYETNGIKSMMCIGMLLFIIFFVCCVCCLLLIFRLWYVCRL